MPIPWSPTPTQLCSFFILNASAQLIYPVTRIRNCEQMAGCQELGTNGTYPTQLWTCLSVIMRISPPLEGMVWSGQLSRLEAEINSFEHSDCWHPVLNNELPAFSTVAHPNSSLNFMPIPMSHWASRTARGSHVSRAAGEWACALHVAKCQASHGDRRRPRRLGWRISFMAIDGLPAIAQVKYLQGRSFCSDAAPVPATALRLRCVGSHGSIESQLPRRAQQLRRKPPVQWLPAAAACSSAAGSPHVGFTRLPMRRTGLCNHRQ